MGSGESKPEKPDIASHDPVEIEAQLMKRQRQHELTEQQIMGRFLDDLDFDNFNETTSSIIKYLQTLEVKHYGEYFDALKVNGPSVSHVAGTCSDCRTSVGTSR